jgi:hypothetical protein
MAWIARYPEFTAVPSNVASLYFSEATLYQVNDGSGPVVDAGVQLMLLNMLTAHIAALYSGQNAASNTPVGRISSASEGSVSASLEYKPPGTASEAWANQTKYGAAWWSATMPYRSMQYRAPPPRNFQPWGWPWPR